MADTTVNLRAMSALQALYYPRVPGDVVGWIERQKQNQQLRWLLKKAAIAVPRRDR